MMVLESVPNREWRSEDDSLGVFFATHIEGFLLCQRPSAA
jgi:hypothetical protein